MVLGGRVVVGETNWLPGGRSKKKLLGLREEWSKTASARACY